MKNKEISKILRDAGIKEHYLWDKPRPKWDEDDFTMLAQIQLLTFIKQLWVRN